MSEAEPKKTPVTTQQKSEKENSSSWASLKNCCRRCYEPLKTHFFHSDQRCVTNAVQTSKYTVWSFIPKCLLYQFSRFSNIYFLSIGIMQLFPVISDSGGIPTALVPLAIVIVVSSIKDLIEDLRRHRSDAEENNRLAKICVDGEIVVRKWGDIRVGDIVKIERNDRIPADLIVLGSSGDFGISYVETKSLDGETNLKHKVAVPEIGRLFTSHKDASNSRVEVICGPPIDNLYEFSGSIEAVYRNRSSLDDETTSASMRGIGPDTRLDDRSHKNRDLLSCGSGAVTPLRNRSPKRCLHPGADSVNSNELEILRGPFPLGLGQFILRGSSLVNTAWIYGLVVYVSKDTRIFQNANTRATFKWSHLEKTYNRHVLILVMSELCFCIFVCIGAALFSRVQWYLAWPHQMKRSPAGEIYISELSRLTFGQQVEVVFTVLGSMFILFAYFVPIDLFLTLEIVRFVQASFVTWDVDMLPTEGTAPTSQSAHLLEELGNITHVFTDKTGTLTMNLMMFRCLGIGRHLIGTTADFCPLNYSQPESECSSPADPTTPYLGEVTPSRFNNTFESLESRVRSPVESEGGSSPSSTGSISSPQTLQELLDANQWNVEMDLTNAFCPLDMAEVVQLVETMTAVERQMARSFLLGLAVCHTVLVREEGDDRETIHMPSRPLPIELTNLNLSLGVLELNRSGDQDLWSLVRPPLACYDASSPDELTFVSASQSIGVEFFRRTSLDKVQLRLLTPFARKLILGERAAGLWERWMASVQPPSGRIEETNNDACVIDSEGVERLTQWVPLVTFDLLDVLEFDNDRKRMSVIIRDIDPCGEVKEILRLLIKGADTNMVSVAAHCEGRAAEIVMEQIRVMAENGLRTLAFGHRVLTEKEYSVFHRRLIRVRAATLHVAEKGSITMEDLLASIEINIQLTGSSGVEDRLQDCVPDVIRELRTCGIKIWVLTGDKPETAINIGHSTHLLTPDTFNAIVDATNRRGLEDQLSRIRTYCDQYGLLVTRARPDDPVSGRRNTVKKGVARDERVAEKKRFGGEESEVEAGEDNRWWKRLWRRFFGAPTSTAWMASSESQMSRADSEEFIHSYILDNDDEWIFSECQRDDSVSGRSTPLCPSGRGISSRVVARRESRGEIQPASLGPHSSSSRAAALQYSGSRSRSAASLTRRISEALSPASQPVRSDTPERSDEDNVLSRLQAVPSQRANRLHRESTSLSTPDKRYTEFSITVTGAALNIILKRRKLLVSFYRLARRASVVIACRVTPKQKSLLVKQSMALNPDCCSSLAIGDGANDVAMILSASVGVGISGKEGLQATRAADFSIAEFRFLRKLLLVHGRESLRRNSFLVYYGIFKNIAFCIASFVYQFECGFSGQDVYNFWIKSLYGTVFVAPTVILYAIFDRELPHYILHHSPITYRCSAPVFWPVESSVSLGGFIRCLRRGGSRIFRCCGGGRRKKQSQRGLPSPEAPATEENKTKASCWKRCVGRLGRICRIPRFRTVPVGVRSYGSLLFFIWFTYAIFVGVIITVLPLQVLKNATSVDTNTFRREMRYMKTQLFDSDARRKLSLNRDNLLTKPPFEVDLSFLSSVDIDDLSSRYRLLDGGSHLSQTGNDSSVAREVSGVERRQLAPPPKPRRPPDEGKSGLDLASVGMVVLLQCIVICNLIVLLAVNSLFWFQAVVMLGMLGIFLGIWALTTWPWFVTTAIPGLASVWGTFGMIQKCTSYYFCIFLSIFLCIIPIFSARAFKVMFEPPEVTVIKERMLQGVFDVVVGRREQRGGEIVVFVPQRRMIEPDTPPVRERGASSIAISRDRTPPNRRALGDSSFFQTAECRASQGAIVPPRPRSRAFSNYWQRQTSPPVDAYRGFAFGFEETLISSAPSVWTVASIATWAGRQIKPPLLQIGRGMGTRFKDVSFYLRGSASSSAIPEESSETPDASESRLLPIDEEDAFKKHASPTTSG